jgi:hypothetical protein
MAVAGTCPSCPGQVGPLNSWQATSRICGVPFAPSRVIVRFFPGAYDVEGLPYRRRRCGIDARL